MAEDEQWKILFQLQKKKVSESALHVKLKAHITIVQFGFNSLSVVSSFFLPPSYYSSSLPNPFAKLGKKSSQNTTRSVSSLLSTLVVRSIAMYLSLSVVKSGQVVLLSEIGGKRGSRLLGSLLETKSKGLYAS